MQPALRNRYEIIERLGSGSTGVVYKCRHRELAGQVIALKILFKELVKDAEAISRFRGEVIQSCKVLHPNVVRCFEYFEEENTIGYSMEYMDDGDLSSKMAAGAITGIDEGLQIVCDILYGLSAVHRAGLLHNNLKPENILVDSKGGIKISDFGAAKFIGVPDPSKHQVLSASIDYIPPEFIAGRDFDERSDIYGVGILAYELVTGQVPFVGKGVIDSMTKRLKEDPIPPEHAVKGCSTLLSEVILKSLARDPKDRFQTADEMREEIERILAQEVLH